MDKYLFHKHQYDFYNKLEKGSSCLPFTKNNILQFFNNIFQQREEYLKQGIIDLFEEITKYHNGNAHHKEGWKTNKNWKINKKIIVNYAVNFASSDPRRWGGTGLPHGNYNVYGFREWLDDLDKVVRRINKDGEKYPTIKEILSSKFSILGDIITGEKYDNTAETYYFDLKFWKKGTLHITFKDDKILAELNYIGAKLRTDLGYDDFGKTTKKKEEFERDLKTI